MKPYSNFNLPSLQSCSLIPTLLPEGEGLYIPLPPGEGNKGEGAIWHYQIINGITDFLPATIQTLRKMR